jgi:hypothetical protein
MLIIIIFHLVLQEHNLSQLDMDNNNSVILMMVIRYVVAIDKSSLFDKCEIIVQIFVNYLKAAIKKTTSASVKIEPENNMVFEEKPGPR